MMNKEESNVTALTWAKVAALTGFLAAGAYFGSVVFKPFPWAIGRLLFFAIGPLSIISALSLYHAVKLSARPIALQVGVLFHIIAGSVLNMMAVVQDSQFTTLSKQIQDAADETAKETLTSILWGVNTVQSGLDVSWDIFISLGTIFIGIAIMTHPRFGKAFGWSGILVAFLALSFNLHTFPSSPASAGLVDLGPVVGLWYVIVLIQLTRSFSWIEKLCVSPKS